MENVTHGTIRCLCPGKAGGSLHDAGVEAIAYRSKKRGQCETAAKLMAVNTVRLHQFRQLGDVGGDAPRLVAGEQVGGGSSPRLILEVRDEVRVLS
jgi:hypothetical protein